MFAGCLRTDSDGAQDLKNIGADNIHVVQIDVTSDQSVSEALKLVKTKLKSESKLNPFYTSLYIRTEIIA